MKLKQVNEAKLANEQKFAYAEIIEGRMGDVSTAKAIVTASRLKSIATDEDALDDFQDEFRAYLIGAVLSDYWDEIQRDLQKQGHWSGMVEEGSGAFSAKGPKHAKLLARAAFVADDDDDDEEDW